MKEKNSQIRFYLIVFNKQECKLERSVRSFQVGVQFHPGHSQPDIFINSFREDRIAILTALRTLFYTSGDTHAFFWLFTVVLKIDDTAPLKGLC